MTTRAVHWHEGMFLRPHHLQADQRHRALLAGRGEKWDCHYNWGLRSIELDPDALANYRLVVRALLARLPDGTLVAVPDDGDLPVVDLKEEFAHERRLTVYLAVPRYKEKGADVAADGVDGARSQLDTQRLEDENTGDNTQPVQVRRLNLRLLLSTHDHAGYDVLPVARLEKSDRAEAAPQLDRAYIPPVLACDAWGPLHDDILEVIYDWVGRKVELWATQVVGRNITFDSQAQGDAQIFGQLRVLNEAYALLGVLVFARGVHPLPAYLELNRLVGQLAVFGPARRPPALDLAGAGDEAKALPYDHDNLGECFRRVKRHIDQLLNAVEEPSYKERPFEGAGQRMQVVLEPDWLGSVYQMYVGVQSPLGEEECKKLLTRAGQLSMKIGSSNRVDEIYRLGLAGLKFEHSPRPPRALPERPGLIYFQVSRQSQEQEWQHVQQSLTLAIRLNENLIDGSIQGKKRLTIRTGGQGTWMEFTLYVTEQEKA
jgi:type VI secretion system protein ImpJ